MAAAGVVVLLGLGGVVLRIGGVGGAVAAAVVAVAAVGHGVHVELGLVVVVRISEPFGGPNRATAASKTAARMSLSWTHVCASPAVPSLSSAMQRLCAVRLSRMSHSISLTARPLATAKAQ
jgi:hypothetical protein